MAKPFRIDGLIAFTGLALALAGAAGFAAPLPASAFIAALFGAAGLAALHIAVTGKRPDPVHILIDLAVIGAMAAMRDDKAAIWQIPSQWRDLLSLTPAGFAVACLLYFLGAINAQLRARRHLSWRESLAILLTPILFNLVLSLKAAGLMHVIGSAASLNMASDAVSVSLGRIIVLSILIETMVGLFGLIIMGRVARTLRLHVLLVGTAVLAALTPLIANLPQAAVGFGPVSVIFIAVAAAALAQAGLWSLTFLLTGVAMDALRGAPPTFVKVFFHAKSGFSKGAIYGGVFMFLLLVTALVLRQPWFAALIWQQPLLLGAGCGFLLYPLIQTLVASADGTPPFFGRLIASYRSPRAYWRGLVVGLGVALALTSQLSAEDGGTRFLALFIVGAAAYGGVDFVYDLVMLALGRRKVMEGWQPYVLGLALGGFVAGALGWYFDAPQIDVVTAKFWAYVDLSYASTGRPVNDFTVYPWFSKWGMLNLGHVGGGVRLFFDESLSGVINWSIAAPLFGINFFVLEAAFRRSLAPLKRLASAEGFIGLVEQTVRVLRWGLWMAPIINSFLRQSPVPSWYNQDGAVRTVAATTMNIVEPTPDFGNWSLSVFTGLLAYDWLRVLIWFDHMGLRVATLVNLTFVGGDRADEAAAGFVGYSARTRFIPEGIRRFATWTPLLIPFYIPRGAAWDTAWSGAERLRAANMPFPLPILQLIGFYAGAALLAGIVSTMIVRRWGHRGPAIAPALPFVPKAVLEPRGQFELSNGLMRLTLQADGRGFTQIEGMVRGGQGVDVTRRITDPLQLRGSFFYLCDAAQQTAWSLGFEPVQIASVDYAASQPEPNLIKLANRTQGIDAEAEVTLADDAPIAIWRLRLTDWSGHARHLRLTSYQELALHEPGSYVRDPDFNAMHVQTWFLKPLNAIFGRNRLLRDKKTGRMSHEIFFHAACVKSGDGRVSGYEDSRTRFIGSGDVRHPDGVQAGAARGIEDQGSLYTFDPAASLTLDIELAAGGTCELIFIDGHAPNEIAAAEIIAKQFGLAPLAGPDRIALMGLTRAPDMPKPAAENIAAAWPFAFSEAGTSLHLTPKTPRPWAHLLANHHGHGAVVSNDGEIHSFVGNERQNALTPFNLESVATSIPGQLIYVVDLETSEADTAGFVPFRRADARYDVTYDMGTAQFRCIRASIQLELTVFTPPEEKAGIRLLTLRNPTDHAKRFRIVPYFEIVLDENSLASRGQIQVERDEETGALLYSNPTNDFRRGWAFAATSLIGVTTEVMRPRFIGGKGRDLTNPVMAETGKGDPSCRADGTRVAAFAGIVEIPAQSAIDVVVVLGQVETRDEACRTAVRLKDVAAAQFALQATRDAWAKRFDKIHIETNQPEFDRLVNHWLPYQLLTSRLWGRTGPNQRGGAFGYRDQLQDVLPLVFFDPAAVRRQIVLHAGQQFPEGDVFKWWHQAPNGKTGLGQRTRASDPHLWLPYVLTRYLAATGDTTVLDEKLPYLEGPRIPDGVIDLVFAGRPSLEVGTVYDHCRRAIDYALARFGSHGLPLIGTGDWNDSIDVAGLHGKGESVWLGFFLYDVLSGFVDLVQRREGAKAAADIHERLKELKSSLDSVWFGDRYPLAFDDYNNCFDVASAMTAAWPILSGVAGFERGRQALDEALQHLEKDDRILLVTPPFDEHSAPYPGRVTDYPPGVRENGGQYSHGVSWVVDAYMRLAAQAKTKGETLLAEKLAARAFACWVKISPIGKTQGDKLAVYGLAPHQQPADIYDGPGYEGRGGWSWYTGSAARMLSAAYAILGLEMKNGELIIPDDLFAPKGALQVKSLRIDGRVIKAGK